MSVLKCATPILTNCQRSLIQRCVHTTAVVNQNSAGRYKPTLKKIRPLTYEMAHIPSDICHKKAWNSWNTSNLEGGNRPAESIIEDMFIRKFMTGTWHRLFLSEIIIKRHHNMVRIAGIIKRNLDPKKIYFLTGYTEELLSYYLHCNVKLELVSLENQEDVIYKYI